MSLPTLTTDLNIIAALDDEPNDVGGLTAAQLKAKFDEAAGAIKTYINSTLLPYFESISGAGDIGITTVSGIQSATNVQAALEALELNIEAITQGAVADNSITNAKLTADAVDTTNIVDDAVTSAKIDDGAILTAHFSAGAVDNAAMGTSAVETTNIADGAVTTAKLAASAVTSGKIASGAITQGKLSTSAIVADNLAANAVTTAKISDLNVTTAKIADGNVTTAKIADSNVTTAKIADSNVTTAKINDSAVTSAKLASGAAVANIGYTPQEQHSTITVTLAAADWSSYAQTGVSATGVTASNTVIVSPDPSDYADYTDAAVRCTAQGSGTLDFACDIEPTSDITVNVLILGV